MKRTIKGILSLFIITVLFITTINAQISINETGNNPDASAILDVSSSDKGILIPRMDSTSRKNISNPATGLMVYDTTTVTFWYYNNSQWNEIRNGTDLINGEDIFENLSADLSCIETVANIDIGQNATDMAVSGNYAYVIDELSNRDLEVIDISNPSNPTLVQTFIDNAFACPLAIAISGNYAYIADRCSTTLVILDISNPLSPTVESETTLANTPNNVILSGNYAYVLETTSGSTFNNVEIIDISNPSNPSQVHSFQTGSKPIDMVIEGNYAYIIDENSNDLKVWDISNVTSPSLVDFQSFGQSPYGISIIGSYAYVVGNVGLKVVDISDPTDISVANTTTVGVQPYSISASDNYLYIIDYQSGTLEIVNVNTPTSPIIAKTITISTNSTAIDIDGNYAYIVDQTDDDLTIVNIEACPLFLGINGSTGVLEATSVDNSWNHQASQNIQLSDFYLSNDGDDEGIKIDNDGNVSINQKLSVTDTVTLSSALIVNGKDLSNIAFTSENGVTYSNNNSDDFVVGTDSLNYGSGGETAENKFFFDYSKGAIRGGSIIDNIWDENNIGFGSVAFGRGTTASGNYSNAIGYYTTASSDYSVAIGREAVAYSYGEIAIGLHNTSYTPSNTNSYDATDRLFVIGNGTPTTDSDAMVVYKNGNTELNGQLTVEDDVVIGNDIVIGADNADHSGSGDEYKVFFDQSLAAFRAGRIQNTNWDETNLGGYSFATGTNTIASGNNSAAFGYQSLASGTHSFAGGNSSEATGAISFTFGREVYAPSYGEVAFGLYGTTYTPNETADFDEDDRLFSIGNGTGTSNRSEAMVVYKSGNTIFNEYVTMQKSIGGITAFPLKIENTNNHNNAYNNGLQITAGQDAGVINNSKLAYFTQFTTPDGTEIGSIRQASSSTVSFNTTSDERLKSNIRSSKYGLQDILNIDVRDYHYTTDISKTSQTGFLAQQLYEVFPVAVTKGGDDAKTNPWTVDYSKLTPLLVKGMQDQQTQIEALKIENEKLKIRLKEVDSLKQQNAEMKAMLEQIQAQLNNQ